MFMFYSSGDPENRKFVIGLIPTLIWILLILFQMYSRLTWVQVNEDWVLTNSWLTKSTVSYNDIIWIGSFDLLMPFGTTIKFKDKNSGKEKKVCYIPKPTSNSKIRKDELADLIRQSIKKVNPSYTKANEPNVVKNIMIQTMLTLPMTLWFLYFVFDGKEIIESFLK